MKQLNLRNKAHKRQGNHFQLRETENNKEIDNLALEENSSDIKNGV